MNEYEELIKKYKKEHDEYEEIIKKYENGQIDFGINLPLARQFLMLNGTTDSQKFIIWNFINFILPIVIFIMAFFKIGFLWGIIFNIVYFVFSFSVTGLSSLDLNKAGNTIVSFVGIFLLLFLIIGVTIDTYIPFILATINLISIYSFYHNIWRAIINNYILKDENLFYDLFENDIFIIKEK